MHEKNLTRLFVDAPLAAGTHIELMPAQYHYLAHALRASAGQAVAVFNGKDGEWRAILCETGRKKMEVAVEARLREQRPAPDIWLAFAPVKNEKIDFTVRRATELGVSALLPVITQRTIAARVNMERLRANAVEAAEQCGRLEIPVIHAPRALAEVLAEWPKNRVLLHADESGKGEPLRALLPALAPGPCAVLIGPEGGFTIAEREVLAALSFTRGISLGPRILRAETAALSALANVMAWLGDWQERPSFA